MYIKGYFVRTLVRTLCLSWVDRKIVPVFKRVTSKQNNPGEGEIAPQPRVLISKTAVCRTAKNFSLWKRLQLRITPFNKSSTKVRHDPSKEWHVPTPPHLSPFPKIYPCEAVTHKCLISPILMRLVLPSSNQPSPYPSLR